MQTSINLQIPTVVKLYLFDIVKYNFQNPNLLEPISNKHTYDTRNQSLTTISFNGLTKTLHSY